MTEVEEHYRERRDIFRSPWKDGPFGHTSDASTADKEPTDLQGHLHVPSCALLASAIVNAPRDENVVIGGVG